ncbi:ArsR family transcriptional regulator [Acidiphilium sp. MT5]
MADAGSSATAIMRPGAAASGIELDVMKNSASEAVEFLRGIANPHRLMILCHLARGEHSVGTLERELGIRQAHLSQQLARLRQDGLVQTRRDSRTIYYSMASDAAARLTGGHFFAISSARRAHFGAALTTCCPASWLDQTISRVLL